MIPFDVVYFRPSNIDEAITAFKEADDEGLKPRFLSGGTEIVTMARDNKMPARAFIDLKEISECHTLETGSGRFTVGACVPLNRIVEGNTWPLLAKASRGVADHTVRNTLTLGGNAAGMLPYREALLPFLVGEGAATLAGPGGTRTVGVREIFEKRLRLEAGEFLVSLSVSEEALAMPSHYERHTKDARVDYPLVSLTMLRNGSQVRAAFAGAAAYPVAEDELDDALSGTGTTEERARKAVAVIEKAIRSDMRAGAEYRQFLLTEALAAGLNAVEG
ncbi:MAG: FAD binding domain-containing protein [Spirochaetaceae bacterium]